MAENICAVEVFWNEFLQAAGLSKDTKYLESFHFELSEKLANELLQLVLDGKKRATCGSLLSYEKAGDSLPQVGDYSIVTDWVGKPRCVIKTTAVTILPFGDVTYEICSREGEDDSLSSWREGHIRYFKADGEELGYEFTEAMPVVFEDFEVVYRA